MKILYTSPNRSHHYRYAAALHRHSILNYFVSGFSRFSPRASLPDLGSKLIRVDTFQNLYLMSLKIRLPEFVSANLAYYAKIEQDFACSKLISTSDVFLHYNGSGLYTSRKAKTLGKISIVETVNSHVEYQEELLKQEYSSLGLPWIPFHCKEKQRRIEEYSIADYVLVPSEFVKQSFISKGIEEERIIKVPYGYNLLDDKLEVAKNKNHDFVILYVGSISVRKGLRYLFEAFKRFQHPRKKLVVVGPQAKYTGIEDIRIHENVEFKGVLKSEDLVQAYKESTVFCLPSIEEGLGLVLGEALSFGKPIISTDNSGAADLITNGKEGFIVPIRNADAILEKLQMLADSPILLSEMTFNAKKRVSSNSGWESSGDKLVEKLKALKN